MFGKRGKVIADLIYRKYWSSYDHDLMVDQYLATSRDYQDKLLDQSRLTKFERQVFSQNGEDGILSEIFHRIHSTNKCFIEFGAGDGSENNTSALLYNGWHGLWIEGSRSKCSKISRHLCLPLKTGQLKLDSTMVTKENSEPILLKHQMPFEPDVLSVDLDGIDYWVLGALEKFRPRVIVAEYNALFPPPMEWIMEYDAGHRWDHSSYYGCSLESLNRLLSQKEYILVSCNYHGMNAFFVRKDVAHEHFKGPHTTQHHYEPLKLHLIRKMGYKRRHGNWSTLQQKQLEPAF